VRIPPYWARGSYTQKKGWFGSDTFTAVGWSFDNIDEARAQADEKAKRIFDRWKNGQTLDRYEYGERHVCEEIVNRIEIDGAEIAIITRNRYGALILNAANVMFIDVDFEVDAYPATGDTIPPGDEMEPKPVEKKAGFWKSLWPAVPRSDSPERRAERENEKRLRITQWFASNPERSGRVYRTAKGFRVILTDRPISPTSDETRQIFQAMKADPLYQKITERQKLSSASHTQALEARSRQAPSVRLAPGASPGSEKIQRLAETLRERKPRTRSLPSGGSNRLPNHVQGNCGGRQCA
jgi:hypothetical protein